MATTPNPSAVSEDERLASLPCEPEADPDPDSLSALPIDEVADLEFQLAGIDNRERSLPIRQGDLNRLLAAEPDLSDDDRKAFHALSRILGATFHSEYYDQLRTLKELYAPLDPDSEYVTIKGHTRPLTSQSDEEFLEPFDQMLIRANFSELDLDHLRAAITAPNELGLTYIPDFSLFEHLKVYFRGYTRISRRCRTMKTGFRKRMVRLDAYQRLVVALKFKPGLELGPFVRSDVVYLRMFKDVPHVDMEMHLPEQGTKVRMRWIDKAQIASPLMVGLSTMVMKFAAITLSPWALMGLAVAPISAGVNSFFGFHRAKQKHLHEMIYRLYYLSLANNASVLTRVVDSAEDEEYKEAMLAYFFLWRSERIGKAWTVPELDIQIEEFLKQRTGIEINFEVADALGKLFHLGLASRDPSGHLHAVSFEQALRVLDRQWDNTFRYT
ncbi:DUF3754 domain-containing protein [Singulisphaera rosea]